MSDVKTFYYPEGGSFGGSSTDGLLLGSMMNGGGMGGGMWNNPIWAIVFLAALRNGGIFGNGGYNEQSQLSQIQDTLNTNQGNTLLMDAIKGNQTAICQLANTLNCNHNAVQTAINAVQSAICNLGSKNDMKRYLKNYGWHFNKAACEFAVSLMKKKDASTGKLKAITPISKEQVDELLKRFGVQLEDKNGYDYVYAANMCKADYLQGSVPDESHLALNIKETIDDPDAGDGELMRCWYAKTVARGIVVDWEDLV